MQELFEAKGQKIDLLTNDRFRLLDSKQAYFIVSGELSLFALEKMGEGTEGPLTFIRTLALNEVVIGLDFQEEDPFCVLIVAYSPSTIYALPQNEWPSDNAFEAHFLESLKSLIKEKPQEPLDRVLLKTLIEDKQHFIKRDQEIFVNREIEEENLVSKSLYDLAFPFLKGIKRSSRYVEPLLAALEVIGENLGCEFKMPKTKEIPENIIDYLDLICRSSNIRYRRIEPKSEWYRESNSPVLLFLKQGVQPLAAICHKKRYEVIDPIKFTANILSETFLDQVWDHAFVFYPTFNESPMKTGKLFWFALKGESRKLILYLVITLFFVAVTLYLPFSLHHAAHIQDHFFIFIFGLIFVASLIGFLAYPTILYFSRFYSIAVNRLLPAIFDHALRLPYAHFTKRSSFEWYSDILVLNDSLSRVTPVSSFSITAVIFVLVYQIAMFFFATDGALINLVLTAAYLIFIGNTYRKRLQHSKNWFKKSAESYGFLHNTLSGFAKTSITHLFKRIFIFWSKTYWDSLKEKLANYGLMNFIRSTYTIYLFTLFFLLSISMEFNPKKIATLTRDYKTGGATLAFLFLVIIFQRYFLHILLDLASHTDLLMGWKEMKAFINEGQDEIPKEAAYPGTLKGKVAFERVSFQYGEQAPFVLQDQSFKVESGELVAITGESGAGKSTHVSLLLGLRQPSGGSVYYDNWDLRELHVGEVRRQISLVTGADKLFLGTLLENLTYMGSFQKRDLEEMIYLLRLDRELRILKNGLNTYLSDDAIDPYLRQRLFLARALLRKPKLYILDEVVSNLDSEVQLNFLNYLKTTEATKIILTHSPVPSFSLMDRIYLLEDGRFSQSGTYDELLEKSLFFKELLGIL